MRAEPLGGRRQLIPILGEDAGHGTMNIEPACRVGSSELLGSGVISEGQVGIHELEDGRGVEIAMGGVYLNELMLNAH